MKDYGKRINTSIQLQMLLCYYLRSCGNGVQQAPMYLINSKMFSFNLMKIFTSMRKTSFKNNEIRQIVREIQLNLGRAGKEVKFQPWV